MREPGWMRRRRRVEVQETKVIRAELMLTATERIEVEDDQVEEWTPRRGMQFASEGTS